MDLAIKLDIPLGAEELNIWRTARQLIIEYGPDARAQAIYRAAKMLEHRNYDGYAAWGLIWTAIKALQERESAAPG